jgi:hypothetical protein
MNNKILIAIVASAFLGGVLQAAEPVKMSKTGICHAPNTTYYKKTKNYTPYPTLQACLNAGGRVPKK